jgi:hypothetical protein
MAGTSIQKMSTVSHTPNASPKRMSGLRAFDIGVLLSIADRPNVELGVFGVVGAAGDLAVSRSADLSTAVNRPTRR